VFGIELYWREWVLMKKIILLFFMLFMALFNNVFAETLYRIKPVHFDISGAMIFMPVKAPKESNLTNNLKFTKLENTNGVEVEIASANFDAQPENVFFSNGNLREFKIVQVDNTVKLILYFRDNYNLSNLKLGNINNNIVITTSSIPPYNMNYYINTYRESENSKDYIEDLTITSRNTINQTLVNSKNDKAMNEINQAFANSNATTGDINTNYVINDISKQNTLRSKYYVSEIKPSESVFKINGVGTVNVQEPFILENPLRMVMDLPNTTIDQNLHNKDLTLNNGDSVKIAQFNKNTARVVVTSKQAKQYIPVYSPDSQTLLVANPKYLLTTHLPNYKSNIIKFNYQKADKVSNLLIEFDKPVMYAIKRNLNEMYLYFLNGEKYNDTNFHSVIKNTPYSDISIHLLTTGLRVKIPLQNKENINTYISPDGKLFKISSDIKKVHEEKQKKQKDKDKEVLSKQEGTITTASKYNSTNNKKVVVLDAGHGGKDCGAIRENYNEKDINLDVCMKIKTILEKKGYKVYMTRTDDTFVSLEDRTIYTEDIYPGAFVSVHVNSCNAETPKGIETHYYHENGIELADCVHKKLISRINTNDRGLFKSRFYVINHTTVPAILVEIGFISNPTERMELITQKRQQATAEGIADGIIEFLKTLK